MNTKDEKNITDESDKMSENTQELRFNTEKCYTINDGTYGCVTLNLNSKQEMNFKNKSQDLISKKDLASDIECKTIADLGISHISSVSVCTNNADNLDNGKLQVFKDFIPNIIN